MNKMKDFLCCCSKPGSPPKIKEGLIFGMGNPLLDISAEVDKEFLEKYKLHANEASLATNEQIPMYKELVEKYNVNYSAGGATQNALRTVAWILRAPNVATFLGAVGCDSFADILEASAINDGLNVLYQKLPEYHTGKCAVLITGQDRCLIAYLAASEHYTTNHLNKPENFAFVERAEVFYIEGYFLVVSPESILTVAQHASENGKTFMMNLSADYIPERCTNDLLSTLPFVDILFGNETEAQSFAQVQKFDTTDVTEIAKKIAGMSKENISCPRTVVLTQGEGPVIVVEGMKVQEFPVTKLKTEQIKDTNGAGDAFSGGFIALYMQRKPLEDCVKCGIWAATEVIQQSGCTFPNDKRYPC